MAVMEQLGPTDVAAAFMDGGDLIVIDARMTPWKFQDVKQKDAAGDEIPAPSGIKAAFVVNDKLHVVDGDLVVWTYLAGSSSWAEGSKIDTKADPEADDSELPWIKGVPVEGSEVKADELRRAKATIDAAEAKDEVGSTKKSKKKEAA